MYVADAAQGFPCGREGRRHELEQCLGEIRGHITIGQRGPQPDRVRCACQKSVRTDPQGLLLNALQAPVHGVADASDARQAFLETLLHLSPLGFARYANRPAVLP